MASTESYDKPCWHESIPMVLVNYITCGMQACFKLSTIFNRTWSDTQSETSFSTELDRFETLKLSTVVLKMMTFDNKFSLDR